MLKGGIERFMETVTNPMKGGNIIERSRASEGQLVNN
jgi:hypothetical protein